jgi:DNA-binding NtrC family response regulator
MLERHFVARFSEQYGKQIRGLTHRAQIRLSRHSWPGNVRELENVIGHAAMMTMNDTIDVQDLPAYLRTTADDREQTELAPASADPGTLQEHERVLLIHALEAAGGNQSKAARILRIGRDALRYKLKKHNLDSPDSGHASAASV